MHCSISVIHNGCSEYLISQRREHDTYANHWEFPGGKQEEGESLEECCIREAKEEVGLDVTIDQFILTVNNPYRHKEMDLHFFLCRVIAGEPQTIECQATQWVKPQQLLEHLFPKANEPIIAYLLKNPIIH